MAWFMIIKLSLVLRIVIGFIFVVSGFGKLIDVSKFADIVESYGFLPSFLVFPFSISLSLLEILCGVMLLLRIWIKFVSVFLLLLLFLFFFALIYGFYYLDFDDCGCFGGILSIGNRLVNLLKSVILIVLVSLYILIEGLYDFRTFFKFSVFILLFSILSILAFGFNDSHVDYGDVDYGDINLSFLGDKIDSSYYLLVIFSPFDCHSCLNLMVPVWNMIDSLYSGVKVLGIAYSRDERSVNYVLDRYHFKFEVRKFNDIPIDFMMTPVEILVDKFGKVYYKVEGIAPTKSHVKNLIRAINKITKQKMEVKI